MFNQVDPRQHFPSMEEKILQFWEKEKIFKKTIEHTINNKPFIFYDGPPFATGLPHYGHFVPSIVKDIIPRYQTMKGRYVERRWGWDCHGLPVEYEMEKELNLKTKKDIINYGIGKFNEACRSIVLRYTKEWEKIINRSGRWVDFENAYLTMDLDYMESIWWVFRSLWDKNLIYEGYKILPYCPRCATPLSNFEVNQGYQDVKDPAITIKFKVKNKEKTYFLAWTTTPWTLPSNLALAVGPDIDYVEVEDNETKEHYILAEQRLSSYYRSDSEYLLVKKTHGKSFQGMAYEPLFPYFSDVSENAFKIVLADYVSTEDGTGVVHTAPGFGEDDYNTGLLYNIPVVSPVDENGEFTSEVTDYAGQMVKNADSKIIEYLKAEHKLVKKETITHSYPHCWRCDSPLIYKAISTWFVDIEKIKQTMVDSNRQIYWVPEHIKDGRFGKWLEGARDWAISRNRFWGTPLPVWKCSKCEHTHCIGSIDELEKKSGKKVTDIHKHFIDHITIPCPQCSQPMNRIEEVLDCWFESGSMPYSQEHYPFENKEKFEKGFPAEFISEGLDQTRGWFYTLTILASALFEKPAFYNCIVNGMVLAEDGKKMSKRLKNYPEPAEVINNYGADALRLYLINSAVIRAEELRFSENGVKEIVKNILLPLWNSYVFFVTYATIDKWEPSKDLFKDDYFAKNLTNELDTWLVAMLQQLIKDVTEALDSYKLYLAVKPIVDFIDKLTNWYIRRSRRRFWKSESDSDKNNAYTALYYTLVTFSKIAAPIMPFTSEEIYKNLKNTHMPESVHLCSFPAYNAALIDAKLLNKMDAIQTVVNLGRSLRTQHNLKIRQPLKSIVVINPFKNELELINDLSDLIKDELNVKKVSFATNEADVMTLKAKPNFKKMGKVLGSSLGAFQKALLSLSTSEIVELQNGKKKKISLNSSSHEIEYDDIIVARETMENIIIANEGHITVGMETQLNEELILEGHAREIVNKIQNMRKEKNFNITDRISTVIFCNETIQKAIARFEEYIKNETLTKKLEVMPYSSASANTQEWNINDHVTKIDVFI